MPGSVKRGIILMNLGSPESADVKDVKKYLDEFLMDERVIDSPYLVRSVLVKGLITPFRAKKSAEAYSTIWGTDGSPLVSITRQLQAAMQQLTHEPVEISMRYGKPAMKTAYDELHRKYPNLQEVSLFPLYPHYAMSSYETAVAHAKKVHKDNNYPFRISVVKPFYNNPLYINALCTSIKPYLTQQGHLLFSYHSIPERHVLKSDVTGEHCLQSASCCTTPSATQKYCYRHQCLETTRLVAGQLGIPAGKYSVAFQSKLGRSEWLKPATTGRMEQMPGEGIKDLLVVCPSFVSDCLETLEEIAIRERENFMKAGGENYTFIPCMNTQPQWVQAAVELCK